MICLTKYFKMRALKYEVHKFNLNVKLKKGYLSKLKFWKLEQIHFN